MPTFGALQSSETIFEVELADFEPIHICPRAMSAAAPAVGLHAQP